MNNLHISYDLNKPGQDYAALITRIKTLGNWAKIHKSYWYVNSPFTAEQAVNFLWPCMDKSDSLYIVNASNNTAVWQNLTPEAAALIKQQWSLSLPVKNKLPV